MSYAFGQGQFVGVGESGTIVSSPDGSVWTIRESNILTDLQKVIFDGTRFVAIGGASVLTSSDGKTWSSKTAPAVLSDLTYGQGKYMAIAAPANADGPHRFATSADAISWGLIDAPFSADPKRVVFSKNVFVAAGKAGDLLSSVDGLTWTHSTISGSLADYPPYLVADSNRFLVTWRGSIYSSDNGSAWQAVANGPGLSYNGVLGYAGGVFFVDEGRHRRGVGFSSDGLVWTYPSGTTDEYAPYYIDFSTVAFGANTYVATEVTYFYGAPNPNSYSIHASPDGRTWNSGSTSLFPVSYEYGANPIVYGLGRYFFNGQSSSDGITWVDGNVKPTHAAGARVFRFPTSGQTGPTIQVSSDGLTFTAADTGMTNPRSVAFGAGRYVIVGDGGKISTSNDARTWSTTTSTTTADLLGVTFAFNRFVAVGSAGTLLTSTDGLAWGSGTATSLGSYVFRRVVAGSDRLLVLGTRTSTPDAPTTLTDGTVVEFATYGDAVFLNNTFLACARVYDDANAPYAWIPHLWKSSDAKSWTDVPIHVAHSRYSSSIPALATGNGSAIFVSQPGTPSSTAVYDAVLQTIAPGTAAPAIVTAPLSQTVARGETVVFAVGATGSGPLQYQWSYAGTAIAGATRAILKLDLITDASAGKYTVTVTNSAGSVTSAAAELTVIAPTPLTITAEPVGGTFFEFEPLDLSVTATGSGPITYQWRRNGQPISRATAPSYSIYASAYTYDSAVGNYDVVVTAPYSTVTSRTVAVTWGGPTVSITPNGIVTRKVGESVSVTATVTGGGPFTYRWLRAGANGEIPGATSNTLVLTNLMPGDSGAITLEVKDTAGHTFRFPSVNLVVTSDYQIGYTASKIEIALGSTFTLGAGSLMAPPGSTYQWYHNGVAIPGATQSALTFAQFSEADAGDYSLVSFPYPGSSTTSPAVTLTLKYARLINLSARGFAGTGEDTLIEGFVLSGEPDGDLLVRSIGPELTKFGITSVLADPYLRVLDAKRALVAENDNWSNPKLTERSVAVSTSANAAVGAFPLSASAKDSAVMVHLAPAGLYTTQVSGEPGSSGLVMNEIYAPPASRQRLVNLSARARVSTGDNILIGGFVIAGTQPLRVLIRGVGPTLAGQGIAVPLMNPKITLYKGTAAIHQNDNWGQAEDVTALRSATVATGAFALNEGSNDAALLVTLEPGVYSVHVASVDGSSGVALVEIYEAP